MISLYFTLTPEIRKATIYVFALLYILWSVHILFNFAPKYNQTTTNFRINVFILYQSRLHKCFFKALFNNWSFLFFKFQLFNFQACCSKILCLHYVHICITLQFYRFLTMYKYKQWQCAPPTTHVHSTI